MSEITHPGPLAQGGPSKSSTFVGFSPTHRHKKTGGLYQLLDIVIDATDGREGRLVSFYKNPLGIKFIQDVEEFMDGRFEEVVL
jgi:hypothetical protein